MSKRRKRETEVRVRACELAADLSAALEDGDPAKLWSRCVFFETYIVQGSAQTRKRMKLGPERAKVLKLVKP